MSISRRGFISSLLAIPVVAKLLPKASPFPLTMRPLEMPININSGMADYAAMYHDRLFITGRNDPPGDIHFSRIMAFDEATGVETPWPDGGLGIGQPDGTTVWCSGDENDRP